jgi:hypothetical protein
MASTSLAPNDTVPLSRWANVLMALPSPISLVPIAAVVARGRRARLSTDLGYVERSASVGESRAARIAG